MIIIFSLKNCPFNKIVVRKEDVVEVTLTNEGENVTVYMKNGEVIKVAETLSEVLEALNGKEN
jgi:hypothetical protein